MAKAAKKTKAKKAATPEQKKAARERFSKAMKNVRTGKADKVIEQLVRFADRTRG